MSKVRFRLLVGIMSFSLIGIIIVQLYWIISSYKNNEEQFKYHVQQVIGNVANTLQQDEATEFYRMYNQLRDSIGTPPKQNELKQYYVVERNPMTNEQIVYSNILVLEDYNIKSSFFDKKTDSLKVKNFVSKRKTEIYKGDDFDRNNLKQNYPDEVIEKTGDLDVLDKAQFDIYFKDIVALRSVDERISKAKLKELLEKELKQYGVNAKFEFGVYNRGLATKIKSDEFEYEDDSTYGVPVLVDNENKSKYQLYITFPEKSKYLFSSLIGITFLSILFTIVIIAAYLNAINQLIKQKQISEIKTDFINNMTHEFKTPIATINLALDAIKNPKVINDPEKVDRYLQMIRDENKRMHAQVENVLRISKLERREFDVEKEAMDVHEIIEDAVEHVSLIIQDRGGEINLHLDARRSDVLGNDFHFTSVIVNILDNAIKYSADIPIIDVYTENVKEYILIKVKDNGVGMSKQAQKRIFDKFYREHTGDLHNVKGHGLGLAYVQQIVEVHNSQVYVESEKGKGSTFIIKMPLIN
ncbi:two-component system, OmpR family, phosphate regulon sensor histidine kinase PhoR [Myroides phaeus]|uniref:histidine kinase n=2 Tax=Myroides phaeus TaxID=702745 RepID=A0A1G8GJA4_9FLAO|nr:HAMP domain-containing sensor histidine kinase [Myroides phaeus]MEC4115891.1 HAMP domain-containing sensor histidine kinase [Myroides phaeus]SDH94453.1 two-component system, OmpR family, phosphate regulon sensor histidine kinase PhoR [Myroides phaeus]